MIIIARADVTEPQFEHLRERIEAEGHISRRETRVIMGGIGDDDVVVGGAEFRVIAAGRLLRAPVGARPRVVG